MEHVHKILEDKVNIICKIKAIRTKIIYENAYCPLSMLWSMDVEVLTLVTEAKNPCNYLTSLR